MGTHKTKEYFSAMVLNGMTTFYITVKSIIQYSEV